jgi:hypothetical protein
MASATKSIGLRRSSQRIPTQKHKQFEAAASGALWTLIYASAALFLATAAIIVVFCLSHSGSGWSESFNRQSKS